MNGFVVATCSSGAHTMRKAKQTSILLVQGHGVEGDAHAGATVKHRSRVAKDPTQPNLRQVHLIPSELHDELREIDIEVAPGEMGENLTTRGIDLLALPKGTRLALGNSAVVEVTGLRNPCAQLEGIQPGLLSAVLSRDAEGRVIRKAGIMSIVIAGGEVRAGDAISVVLPEGPHHALECV